MNTFQRTQHQHRSDATRKGGSTEFCCEAKRPLNTDFEPVRFSDLDVAEHFAFRLVQDGEHVRDITGPAE